jgi:hypothetical protein
MVHINTENKVDALILSRREPKPKFTKKHCNLKGSLMNS